MFFAFGAERRFQRSSALHRLLRVRTPALRRLRKISVEMGFRNLSRPAPYLGACDHFLELTTPSILRIWPSLRVLVLPSFATTVPFPKALVPSFIIIDWSGLSVSTEPS